jgi:type VII secretion protein EccB
VHNRKDLLQAHRLMTQRAALALVCGEPDSPDQPLRRFNTAIISSVLAGVIVAAVFGVLGLLSPGAVSGLTNPGTLVMDKDTGASYVPCGSGQLCPTLNYASALLALNTSNVNKVSVSQASLSHYSIGPTIGIANLPQDLPTSADLVQGPWSVCAAGNAAGNVSTTLVGGRSVGGTALTLGQAVLVTAEPTTGSPTGLGGDWLLWNSERLPIDQSVIQSPLFNSGNVQEVPAPWLNAIPQGPNFAAPMISGLGNFVRGPSGTQARVGQVYSEQLTGGGTKNFVLKANGQLASVTDVQAALLELELKVTPIPLLPGTRLSGTPVPDDGLPKTTPMPATTTSPLCERYDGQGSNPRITVGGAIPAGAVPANAAGAGIGQVWLPPGHGALIGTGAAASTSQSGTVTGWFLVTGATRYALSASSVTSPSSVATALGYNLAAEQTVLPASVLELLPQGPAMDPGAATQRASN